MLQLQQQQPQFIVDPALILRLWTLSGCCALRFFVCSLHALIYWQRTNGDETLDNRAEALGFMRSELQVLCIEAHRRRQQVRDKRHHAFLASAGKAQKHFVLLLFVRARGKLIERQYLTAVQPYTAL